MSTMTCSQCESELVPLNSKCAGCGASVVEPFTLSTRTDAEQERALVVESRLGSVRKPLVSAKKVSAAIRIVSLVLGLLILTFCSTAGCANGNMAKVMQRSKEEYLHDAHDMEGSLLVYDVNQRERAEAVGDVQRMLAQNTRNLYIVQSEVHECKCPRNDDLHFEAAGGRGSNRCMCLHYVLLRSSLIEQQKDHHGETHDQDDFVVIYWAPALVVWLAGHLVLAPLASNTVSSRLLRHERYLKSQDASKVLEEYRRHKSRFGNGETQVLSECRQACLLFDGTRIVYNIPMRMDEVSVGRNRSNHICLRHPNERFATLRISKKHFVIYRCWKDYLIRDVGSMNGVRLNGAMLARDEVLPLNNGDKIEVGESIVLEFRFGYMQVGDSSCSYRYPYQRQISSEVMVEVSIGELDTVKGNSD